MAAVEKRKSGISALLINHLMFMFICMFIVFPLSGTAKIIFGSVMSFMYYYGVHDYCQRAGREHAQPFTEITPSWKFPFYYGIIGNIFFWLPIIAVLILGSFNIGDTGTVILRLIYLIWDSPFIFLDIFQSTEFRELSLYPVLAFSLLYFAASFSGYYLGKRGNSLIKIIKVKFGKKKKKNKENEK